MLKTPECKKNNLSNLKTTNKESLVGALNEVFDKTYGKMQFNNMEFLNKSFDEVINLGYSSIFKFNKGATDLTELPRISYRSISVWIIDNTL